MTTKTAAPKAEESLYATHIKVFPRAITGTFRTLKWSILWLAMAAYHLVPWIRWDRGPDAPDQAILMDLAGRRAYFFNFEIWPQEIYYLTGFLILAAVDLFFATALFGRVFCGFFCPQTVWTDLFTYVERRIEGDRNKRLKLDRGPWTGEKILKRSATHSVWVLISFLMSFAWIWFFNDAPSVTIAVLTGQASGWVYTFIGMLTATTYTLAGLAREQVCIYMCPWPRFQGAMFDEDSLIVTYEEWRGEPRAKASRDRNFDNRGHCVDCGLCVHVCPTGIDIRDGQQMQCIGCALCVDACAQVMRRFDLPTGLITYDSNANQVARAKDASTDRPRLIRPRTIIYAAILAIVAAVMLFSMATRSRLEVNIIRDRAPLFVQLSSGDIRNAYTYKILNMERRKVTYELSAAGIDGVTLSVIGQTVKPAAKVTLVAKPDTVAPFRVLVNSARGALDTRSTDMTFVLTDLETGETVRNETVFAGPGR